MRWWKGHCKSCPEDLAPVWKACIIGLRLPLGGRRSRVAKGASGMFSCQSNEWAKTSQATWKRIRFDPTKILKSGPATMEASSSTFSIPMTKDQWVFLSGCLLSKTAGVFPRHSVTHICYRVPTGRVPTKDCAESQRLGHPPCFFAT